jgi:hypothetical protein
MSKAILNELLDKHAIDGSPLHVDMPELSPPTQSSLSQD